MKSKKKSLEQVVYDKLESAILLRKLAPGTQLVETAISNQLNVSRTPIRNAIKKLKQENLVEMLPNKGAYVINPSKKEVLQAYELRKELEIMAAIKALNFLTYEDFKKMELYLEDEQLALEDKNLRDYLQANQNFHMTIIAKSGNEFLIQFISELIKRTNIYVMLFDRFFEEHISSPNGPNEHNEIILQLKNKNQTKLKTIINQHFQNAFDELSFEKSQYKDIKNIL